MIEWIDIEGYEGLYKVGSNGEIKSIVTGKGKILKGGSSKGGYRCATLCFKGNRRQEKHHRLVAKYFIPNPENLPIVMHLDNNTKNNSLYNLKWGTSKDNVKQMWDEGRTKSPCYWKGKKRELHYLSKVVYQYTVDNIYIRDFISIKSAAELYKISSNNISDCCRGKQKTSCGYKWSYNLNVQ